MAGLVKYQMANGVISVPSGGFFGSANVELIPNFDQPNGPVNFQFGFDPNTIFDRITFTFQAGSSAAADDIVSVIEISPYGAFAQRTPFISSLTLQGQVGGVCILGPLPQSDYGLVAEFNRPMWSAVTIRMRGKNGPAVSRNTNANSITVSYVVEGTVMKGGG